MSIPTEIPAWDQFFFYGKGDLHDEAVYDLNELLFQPKRSLFYNRRASAGVTEYENNPNGIGLQVFARYEIANAVAYRNSQVSDGSDGLPDRRIAVSQTSIGFEQSRENLDIRILYFLYSDYEEPRANSFPLIK